MHPVTLCIFLSWEESAVLVCLNLLPFVLVRMLECLVVGASRIPTVVFNRVQRDVVGVVICCCGGCRTPTEAFRDLVDEHGIMGVYSGFTASLFAAIKPAIHFGIFEQIKKTVLQGARKELGFVEVCHSSKVFARIAFCTPPRSNVRTCGRVPEQALCDAVSHFVGFCSAD
eukprot:m.1055110 g.1055110  ORF g.1055110 m.1055110 type:complete len:171 (+) comp24192_c1_seq15:1294-1806(+)